MTLVVALLFDSSSAGGGCVRLRVESQGQRASVLGAGTGQRASSGFSGRNPLSKGASPEEFGYGQRVPPSLAGKRDARGFVMNHEFP